MGKIIDINEKMTKKNESTEILSLHVKLEVFCTIGVYYQVLHRSVNSS